MIGIVITFLIVFSLLFFGIPMLKNLPKEEKLSMIRIVCYTIACSVLTFMLIIGFVILF